MLSKGGLCFVLVLFCVVPHTGQATGIDSTIELRKLENRMMTTVMFADEVCFGGDCIDGACCKCVVATHAAWIFLCQVRALESQIVEQQNQLKLLQ